MSRSIEVLLNPEYYLASGIPTETPTKHGDMFNAFVTRNPEDGPPVSELHDYICDQKDFSAKLQLRVAGLCYLGDQSEKTLAGDRMVIYIFFRKGKAAKKVPDQISEFFEFGLEATSLQKEIKHIGSVFMVYHDVMAKPSGLVDYLKQMKIDKNYDQMHRDDVSIWMRYHLIDSAGKAIDEQADTTTSQMVSLSDLVGGKSVLAARFTGGDYSANDLKLVILASRSDKGEWPRWCQDKSGIKKARDLDVSKNDIIKFEIELKGSSPITTFIKKPSEIPASESFVLTTDSEGYFEMIIDQVRSSNVPHQMSFLPHPELTMIGKFAGEA